MILLYTDLRTKARVKLQYRKDLILGFLLILWYCVLLERQVSTMTALETFTTETLLRMNMKWSAAASMTLPQNWLSVTSRNSLILSGSMYVFRSWRRRCCEPSSVKLSFTSARRSTGKPHRSKSTSTSATSESSLCRAWPIQQKKPNKTKGGQSELSAYA